MSRGEARGPVSSTKKGRNNQEATTAGQVYKSRQATELRHDLGSGWMWKDGKKEEAELSQVVGLRLAGKDVGLST